MAPSTELDNNVVGKDFLGSRAPRCAIRWRTGWKSESNMPGNRSKGMSPVSRVAGATIYLNKSNGEGIDFTSGLARRPSRERVTARC